MGKRVICLNICSLEQQALTLLRISHIRDVFQNWYGLTVMNYYLSQSLKGRNQAGKKLITLILTHNGINLLGFVMAI